MSIFKAENVCKKFGFRTIFSQGNFELETGELVAIYGLNGTGKSTLLSCLAGLSSLSEGRVFYQNKLVQSDIYHFRKTIFFIEQNYFLYEELTLEENLRFFLKLHYSEAYPSEEFYRVLEEFGLRKYLSVRVGLFSSGMKRKARLVLLKLLSVGCIFLDEPYNNLDYQTCSRLTELIQEKKEQGCLIFLVTHHLDFCFSITDQILLLHKTKFENWKPSHFDGMDDFLDYTQKKFQGDPI